MNKIYTVEVSRGDWDDYSSWIHKYCKDLETAEKEKQKLEEKIQKL